MTMEMITMDANSTSAPRHSPLTLSGVADESHSCPQSFLSYENFFYIDNHLQ